jgi:prolyl-tRNA editing enzyme YbaK/EbsC (Cys-tRNA(Pro) deacylase)
VHPTVESFAERARDRHGIDVEVRGCPDGTKTAPAVDCHVGRIIRSIVVRVGGRPVPVPTRGANRVAERALAAEFDVDPDRVRTADTETVKEATGWGIGGVPPLCHDTDRPTLADPAARTYDILWAAAGTPKAVFSPDGDARLDSQPAVRRGV